MVYRPKKKKSCIIHCAFPSELKIPRDYCSDFLSYIFDKMNFCIWLCVLEGINC